MSPTGVYERRPEHYEKAVAAMRRWHKEHPKRPAEWGRKISEAKTGQPFSDEHRAAISRAQTLPDALITYGAAHIRMRREHPLTHCERADDTCSKRFQYALRHTAPMEHLRRDDYGVFSVHREDYISLCVSHHKRYDNKKG